MNADDLIPSRVDPSALRSVPKNRWPHAQRRAFTLTEVMIAIAIVALLLVGISRIFAMTSTTIGTGQAMATSMRSMRAVQQALSMDILGAGDLGSGRLDGMAPLVNSASPKTGAPFLTISNFRVATYLNQAEARADFNAPNDEAEAGGTMSAAKHQSRSLAIRGMDLNNNGDETDAGEVVPIYAYGSRNFRCDTIGFFTNGRFASQSYPNATSNESYVWYGHLRVFNSNFQRLGLTNAYGGPGERDTGGSGTGASGPGFNRNNLYAEQFMLGRYQLVMIDQIDHDGDGTDPPASTPATVVAGSDPTAFLPFAARDWQDPADGVATNTPQPLPFDFASTTIQLFDRTSRTNKRVRYNNADTYVQDSRCDIVGVNMPNMRDRARAFDDFYASQPSTSKPNAWQNQLPIRSASRFNVNPFPAPDATLGLSADAVNQRQQLLASACSQFIVEFAGDFVTQNPLTGDFDVAQPDGILDFIVVGGVRGTRWYGLPRDSDGDGTIDVLPVGLFANLSFNTNATYPYPFERDSIARQSSYDAYGKVVADVGSNPDGTSYVCVWTTREFEKPFPGTNYYAVPQLIRFVVELRDPAGRMKQPMTQEFVLPVARR